MTGPTLLTVSYLVCGIVIFLLGLTLLRVGRTSAPTRAAALMLFFAGVGPLLSASGMFLETSLRHGAVLYTSMVENFEYLWEFYFPSLLLFALSFPVENRVLNRYPVIGLLIFAPYLFHVAAVMFGDRMLDALNHAPSTIPVEHELKLGPRVLHLGGIDAVVGALVRLLERVHRNLFAFVNVVYSLVALDILWRNQVSLVNPRLARQLRTVTVGVAVSVACYAVAKISILSRISLIPENASVALLNLSLVASGATIAYAVIRQQFLGVRNIIQRSVLYGVVSLAFAVLYLVVVRPVTEFFTQYSASGRGVFETGFVVLVVLAFQPVLERAETLLDRALIRGRGGLSRRFKGLSDAVAAATTMDALDQAVTRGLRETLDASQVSLDLVRDAADPVPAALSAIGEPVRRGDLLEARETRRRRKKRRQEPARPTVAPEHLPDRVEVFVPVMQEGACVAYLALAEKVYGLTYGAEELGHLAVLSTQIAAALVNIRLLAESVDRQVFEEELKIARKVQMQMLPGEPPPLPGFELYGVTVPSRQVGGDYYDFVRIDDRWLAVVVADVSGKGIPASILTATLQATVRTNTDAQASPSGMMARLNRLLYRNTSAAEFATAFYALIDLESGELRYANAGHDFPFVLGNGGTAQLDESGIVLGCIEDYEYGESGCLIPSGGALVVFTDGVPDSESRTGDYYGTERLRAVLERHGDGSARDICRRVIEEVRGFGDGENQDDLTLVVLKRTP